LIRRGFKIYPAFWTLFAITVVAGFLVEGAVSTRKTVGDLLFLQNYVGSHWDHTWSLAVEEHFYLLLALLVTWQTRWSNPSAESSVATTGRNPFSALPAIFVAVALACLLLRAITSFALPYSHSTHLFATHLRLDSLLFGVVLSYYWHFGRLRESPWLARHAYLVFIAGLALLAPAFFFELETTPWVSVVGLPMFYLGSGCVLLALLQFDFGGVTLARSFAAIGAYSYSIYLWHLPIAHLVKHFQTMSGQPLNWFLYAGLYGVASIGVGIAMSKLVEYPVLRVRERLYPSRSGDLRGRASAARGGQKRHDRPDSADRAAREIG
jgi:peptidoglycan/LPS O-acetylase OafA/YrhL